MGLLLGLSLLLLSACGGQGSAKGGAGQEHNKSTSGGTASTNGQIVFRRWFDPDHTKGALFAMNPDGSHIRQITHPPKGWFDDNPAWSPDGQRVAFHRQRPNDYISRITVLNFQTGDTREVTHCGPDQGWSKEHPRPTSGRYCEGDREAAFSPDGKSIAFHRTICPCDESSIVQGIFIGGLDGSDPHQVTNVDPKLPEAFADLGSAFSPDGKMLVFDREQRKKAPKLVNLGEEEPYYHAVFVQSLDSSGKPEDARQITPWKANCQDHPEYSPDGKLVLFRCLPKGEEGPSNLYWVHPDGTGLHKLTHEDADKQYLGSSFSPSFSGEGGWITAGRTGGYGEEGNADVFRLLIKDGEVARSENLTKSAIWDSAPVWGTHPPVG
jgi:tricorn protease-like protein